jgi:CDP-glucose 4,6-dehydratase
MWGGNAVRDYLYIDDAVNAFIALMKVDIRKVGKNRVFNFGTGNLTSVRDLMEKILKISSSNLPIKKIGVQREDEIKNQYVAVSKAKKLLAWTPKVDIDKGLSLTIAWYKDNV